MKMSMRKIFFDQLARRRAEALDEYMKMRAFSTPQYIIFDEMIKEREEKAMKEITIDGRKYRLVEDEPKLDLSKFSVVKPQEADCIATLDYDGWALLHITSGGQLKYEDSISPRLGFDLDSDGELCVHGE